MQPKYRHENKYPCSVTTQRILTEKIKCIMNVDPHVGEDGFYEIRSIYFDDYENTFFYENQDGVEPRQKYRIRTYKAQTDHISLECKIKKKGMTLKRSCPLNRELAESLLKGVVPLTKDFPTDLKKEQKELLQRFCVDMKSKLLRPKVLVIYERYPFVYRNGNVRVTFDTHLRYSNRFDLFFEDFIPGIAVFPNGQLLLEVKYDEFLPLPIKELLQVSKLRQSNFSKYYLCRVNTMGSGIIK